VTICRKRNGDIATGKDEVVTQWKEYFQDALSGDIGEEVEDYPNRMNMNIRSEEEPPPSLEEVSMAVKCLNNNRSPGMGGIPTELYKHGGTKILQYIHSIVTDAWERESLPAEWEEGIICPIHEKGDCLRCENYRGVTLLNTVYKIFSKILSERLRPKIEAILEWYQTGFWEGKSTIDQIYTLRQILERMKEQNITAFYLFVDFKSAFDSVIREQLYATMSEMGIPMKLVKLTRAALKRVRIGVKIQGITS